MTHPQLSIEKIYASYEPMDRFHIYDISKKVKEANEALRSYEIHCNGKKELKVKFCKRLVDYEPEYELSSEDDGYDESTDKDGFSISSDFSVTNQQTDSPIIETTHSMLEYKERTFVSKSSLVEEAHSTELNDTIKRATLEGINYQSDQRRNAVEDKEYKIDDGIHNSKNVHQEPCSKNETNNGKNYHFPSPDSEKILNDSIPNKIIGKDSELMLEMMENFTKSTDANKTTGHENTLSSLKTCQMPLQYSHESEIKSDKNELSLSCNEKLSDRKSPLFMSEDEDENLTIINGISSNEEIDAKFHRLQLSPCSLRNSKRHCNSNNNVSPSYKWSNIRLPNYNGMNSEYGLSAEMLEERKKKTETMKQRLKEKKLQEDATREQKKKENDESFRSWLKKKEEEKLNRVDEDEETFQLIFDKEEAEIAFQQWLRRKAKEKRCQRKMENHQREQMEKIFRESREQSQKAFKRWLQSKKKSTTTDKNKRKFKGNFKMGKNRKHISEQCSRLKNISRIYMDLKGRSLFNR